MKLKFHLRSSPFRLVADFEELALHKTEHAADEIRREHLKFGIEVARVAIVEAT